jgi:hypothetical protein
MIFIQILNVRIKIVVPILILFSHRYHDRKGKIPDLVSSNQKFAASEFSKSFNQKNKFFEHCDSGVSYFIPELL